MKHFLCLALLLCIGLPFALSIWPQPVSVLVENYAQISPSKFTVTSSSSSAIVSRAIGRYNKLYFPFPANSTTFGSVSIQIHVTNSSEELQFGVDESYSLSINSNGQGTIVSQTVWGALHGLETLSQLISWDDVTHIYSIAMPVTISDAPRFPWRGFLMDTARHFLDLKTIYRAIDALSYAKFNVLHWHAIDAQSFPIKSEKYPKFIEGAYSPSAIYTLTDIKNVVQYATDRGIRVVPEFDIPGHAASWGKGYPEVTVTDCSSYTQNINNIPLNPTLKATYDLVSGFLSEMTTVFSDDYLHVGGDEVVFGCWMQDPQIVQWMQQNGIATSVDLYGYFEKQLVNDIVPTLNKKPIVWEEVFDNNVVPSKSVVIEVWKDQNVLQQVIQAGYAGILAAGYYLDKQIPNPQHTWYEWVDTWKNFYQNDPLSDLLASWDAQGVEYDAGLVLGGEAAMWGEQVDSVNFDSRVWPRAAATAERLWSPSTVNDVSTAVGRLAQYRCTSLAQRGIGAGPVQPDFCPLPSWYQK